MRHGQLLHLLWHRRKIKRPSFGRRLVRKVVIRQLFVESIEHSRWQYGTRVRNTINGYRYNEEDAYALP